MSSQRFALELKDEAVRQVSSEVADKPATAPHVAMSLAQQLKRVCGVEIEACARGAGKLKIPASIEEPPAQSSLL
jgi:hypothetical protein